MVSDRHLDTSGHREHFNSGATQAHIRAIIAVPSLCQKTTLISILPSFNMLLLSVILLVVALTASCDAYAHHAPAHVGGISTNNLPLLPRGDLFARNDTNSSRVPGVYKLSDLYDYTNFFDKFSFVEVSTRKTKTSQQF